MQRINTLNVLLLTIPFIGLMNNAVAVTPPPKPTKTQIANDLVGYKLSEGFDNGWFDKEWTWQIKKGQIKAMNIKEVVRDTNGEYCVVVLMRLQNEFSAFNAKAKISYALTKQKQWRIEFVNSLGMSVVKTHKYDDCIQFAIVDDGWGGVDCLEIKNNCSVELAVAGWFYALGEWKKYATRVQPYETVPVGGTFGGGSVSNYKVEFIERL